MFQGARKGSSADEVLSTERTAKLARISYVTLRRWLARGDFQGWLKASDRVPLGVFDLGNGKRIWRFSNGNRIDLYEYRDLFYQTGRGQAARLREEVKRERNQKRALKRTLERTGVHRRRSIEEKERSRLLRLYAKTLAELRAHGIYPRDRELEYIIRGKRMTESAIFEAVVRTVVAQDHRDAVERLGATLDPTNERG
jgi:hypothetical protein